MKKYLLPIIIGILLSAPVTYAVTLLPVQQGGTGRGTLNAGSILFGNTKSAVGLDTLFVWDNTNNKLGVGTSTPDAYIDVYADSIDNVGLDFTNANANGNARLRLQANTAGGGRPFLQLTDWNGVGGDTATSGASFTLERETNKILGGDRNDLVIQTFSEATPNNILFGIAASEIMRIANTGNVGIGTTSPYAKLSSSVASSDSVIGLVVKQNNTSGTYPAAFFSSVEGSSNDPVVVIEQTDALNAGGVTLRLSDNPTSPKTSLSNLGHVEFYGDNSVASNVEYASIFANQVSTTSGAHSADIVFHAFGAGATHKRFLVSGEDNGVVIGDTVGQARITSGSEDLILSPDVATSSYIMIQEDVASGRNILLMPKSTGNVGIGTTTPYAKLSVVGPVVAEYFYATSSTATSTFAGQVDIAATAANGAGLISQAGSRFIHSFGTNNFFAGVNAGNTTLSSFESTAVGGLALSSLATGNDNTAIGYKALQSTTDGAVNTAVGTESGSSITTGNSNVAFGYQALVTNIAGHRNSAFGQAALGLTTGSNNIGVGYQAGDNLTTGSKNIIIGTDIDIPGITTSNQLNIGNIIFGTGVSGTGSTIAGNIGIGTSTPLASFQATTPTANATTSIQFGKANQNKGICMTYYDTAGSPVYMFIAAGGTTFTSQNGGTAPSGCQN